MSLNPRANRLGSDLSPRLLADMLLSLIAHARQASGTEVEPVMTAQALAETLHVSPSTAKSNLGALALTRCLRPQRTFIAASSQRRRAAQGYGLPPVHEERGPGRRSRMFPVGLVVAPNEVDLAQYGRLMRQEGILPVGVANSGAACILLQQLGFEFLLVTYATDGTGLSAAEVQRIHSEARQAACGAFLVANADAQLLSSLNENAGTRPFAEFFHSASFHTARMSM